MTSVQIAVDNHDIIHNPKVRELYPTLYKEVYEQDKISHSSWYDLSNEAHQEFTQYCSNNDIGYYK